LVVDDFGEKYVGREHAEYLMPCIKKKYNISSNWNGDAYCGLNLDWDYKNLTVGLSMPGYINAALYKYQHPAPARPEHAPHTWNPPMYGEKTQFMTEATSSPALSDKEINKLQQLTGTLLYYARDVDQTLIMPINVLASKQSKATNITADKVITLLNYCNTHSRETSVKVYCVSNVTRIIPRPKRCHGDIPRSNMSQDMTGSFKEYSCTNAPAFMHLINLTASYCIKDARKA
jgi:hypothetical protein